LAEAWVEGREEPFFLFLNYMDPHDPWRAPAEFADFFPGRRRDWPRERNPRSRFGGASREAVQEHVFSQYDSQLAYLDFHLGRLLDHLGAGGRLDRSIVIITSDHGEQFLEHEGWGHGQSLYQEEVHVPLIIRDPASRAGEVRHLVEHRDLAPWLLERVRLPLPPGVDPSDLSTGRRAKVAALERSPLGRQLLFRRGDWTLIRSEERGDELYDLSEDAAQQENLGPDHARAKQLGAEATRWTDEHLARPSPPADLEIETLRALIALGYVDDGSQPKR
jgi:arylsulfatase A-like enzyme